MHILKIVLLFITLLFSNSYPEEAMNFTLKDRVNHSYSLINFKKPVVVLIFSKSDNLIAVERAKLLKKIFGKDIELIFIVIDNHLTPTEFNRFVVKNRLEKEGIITLKGDDWIVKAYSVNEDKPTILILERGKDKFFIVKRFDNFENLENMRLLITSIINRPN